MIKDLPIIIVCITLLGCATVPVPGKIEVSKGNIQAQGTIATEERGGALIRSIQIDLVTEPPEFLEDIWVEIHNAGKTKLAVVLPQLLKDKKYSEISVESTHNGLGGCYRGDGFTFEYDRNDKLIHVKADTGSSDETSTENPIIGSFSSGLSLALPCSLPQFQSVFGKPNKVRFLKIK